MLNILEASMFSFPTMLILSTFSIHGLFDGDLKQLPYGEIRQNQVRFNAHQELVMDPTRHGIVLLKNE
jgi:hypothetical protein